MLATAYYFLQVILCSGLLMGYYWCVLRNNRFHQYNRFYLLGIAALSWLVPLVKIRWSRPVAGEDAQVIQFLSVVADSNTEMDQTLTRTGFQWNLDNIAMGIYCLVGLVLLVSLLRALFRLYRLLQVHSCKNVGDVYLVLTRARGTPFSFFRYIFWNEEIDMHSESGKQILQHELTHVQQKHSIDKLFLQLMLIGGWFNPFFWLLRKEMDMIHEFIADKKAVGDGDTAALAQMLLTAAYPQQQFGLTHSFFFSPIKRRLQMLTHPQRTRFSYLRRLIILPLLAIMVILFAFRNKEQRANGTLSVASVIESGFSTYNQGLEKIKHTATSVYTTVAESDTVPSSDTVFLSKGKVDGRDTFRITKKGLQYALYLVNGQRVDRDILNTLDPNLIAFVSVLKNAAAVAQYGDAGKNGVVLIATKNLSRMGTAAAAGGTFSADGRPVPDTAITEAMFIPRMREFLKRNSQVKDAFARYNPLRLVVRLRDHTEEMYDLTNAGSRKRAERIYGPLPQFPIPDVIEEGTFRGVLHPGAAGSVTSLGTFSNLSVSGVIEGGPHQGNVSGTLSNITSLGNLNALTVSGMPMPVYRGVLSASTFTVTGSVTKSISSLFRNMEPAWNSYLQKNLSVNFLRANGAPPGTYVVNVEFVIDETGNPTYVHAVNDPGYGTANAAENLVKNGPKWEYARGNAELVRVASRKAITFILPEKGNRP